jgi:hypothetical protein
MEIFSKRHCCQRHNDQFQQTRRQRPFPDFRYYRLAQWRSEGFPVDDLIGPNGSLTGNGFGYETAAGNFANPFFADFLTPPTFREVVAQPAFSEVSIQFQARIVPGVTIATAAPAVPGDTMSLDVIHAPRSGFLSLHGTSVQYIPANKNSHTPVTFSFDLMAIIALPSAAATTR